jgi:hypothetical protein
MSLNNSPAAGLLHRLKLWYPLPIGPFLGPPASSRARLGVEQPYRDEEPCPNTHRLSSEVCLATEQSLTFHCIEHQGVNPMLGLFGLLRHLFAALQKTLTFREKLARFASNPYPKPHHNATLWVNVVPIPFRPVRRLRSVGCRLRSVIPFSMWGFVGGFSLGVPGKGQKATIAPPHPLQPALQRTQKHPLLPHFPYCRSSSFIPHPPQP